MAPLSPLGSASPAHSPQPFVHVALRSGFLWNLDLPPTLETPCRSHRDSLLLVLRVPPTLSPFAAQLQEVQCHRWPPAAAPQTSVQRLAFRPPFLTLSFPWTQRALLALGSNFWIPSLQLPSLTLPSLPPLPGVRRASGPVPCPPCSPAFAL